MPLFVNLAAQDVACEFLIGFKNRPKLMVELIGIDTFSVNRILSAGNWQLKVMVGDPGRSGDQQFEKSFNHIERPVRELEPYWKTRGVEGRFLYLPFEALAYLLGAGWKTVFLFLLSIASRKQDCFN